MIQEKEAWEEDEMEESDWVTYQWDKTKSKQKILQLKQKIDQVPALIRKIPELSDILYLNSGND